jgi:NAD(P)-dependent dehydrogenase (short-subunit alcohol dehydrogenase family)
MDVEGKTAIVSGAASGIGRATALLLARKGARVLLTDINEDQGREALREAALAEGTADFLRMDATSDAAVQAAIERVVSLWGQLDIMFNNAGILTGAPRFPETAPEQWTRVIDLNLTAVIRGTQLAYHAMRATGGGVIVNTASMSGITPWPLDPVYSASKGVVVFFFTKALAGLAQSANVRVNCVCPTSVETPLLAGASDKDLQDLYKSARVKADDVAHAVLRLIEDDSAAGKALTVLPDQEPAYA